MGRSRYRKISKISCLSGPVTVLSTVLCVQGIAAHANEDLILQYEHFRVNDQMRPLLVYRISPAKSAYGFEKLGEETLRKLGQQSVFNCDGDPIKVNTASLVSTEERCKQNISGPLTFKTFETGQSFDIIDPAGEPVGSAVWNGSEFSIKGTLAPDLAERLIAEYRVSDGKIDGLDLHKTGFSIGYDPDNWSIDVDLNSVNYVKVDNRAGVALNVVAFDQFTDKGKF